MPMRSLKRRSAAVPASCSANSCLESAIHRVDCAVELDQEPVSSTADQTAAMLGDFRLDRVLYVIREPKVRPLLVDTHQSTVADDVRDHDNGQPPFRCGRSIRSPDPPKGRIKAT